MKLLAFLTEYWLEFLLGIIATGATAFAKYFYNLYKKEKSNEKEEEYQKQKDVIMDEVQELINKKHKKLDNTDKQIIN